MPSGYISPIVGLVAGLVDVLPPHADAQGGSGIGHGVHATVEGQWVLIALSASASSASAGRAASTWRRTTRSPRWRWSRSRAWRTTRAPRSPSSTGPTPHALARWEDLLDVDGLDAVSIAVPTFLHAPIAIAALERGLHVLSEKPIARTHAEAEQMVEAARAAGRVLDVAFNHRRRGDIRPLADRGRRRSAGRRYYAKAWWMRRTGIPTLGSWFTPRRARRRRAAARHRRPRARLRAVPARPADGHGGERLDVRPAGHRGLRLGPRLRQDGRRTRPRCSTSRTSRPRSCAYRTAARCSSRRAGRRTARPATSSASRSTARRAARSCASSTWSRSAR